MLNVHYQQSLPLEPRKYYTHAQYSHKLIFVCTFPEKDKSCQTCANFASYRCPKGTDGKDCQTSPERCIGSPCMNGGICEDFGSGQNCSCPDAFTGIGCQFEYDACAENACQNGATCIDEGGNQDYQCICPPGKTTYPHL